MKKMILSIIIMITTSMQSYAAAGLLPNLEKAIGLTKEQVSFGVVGEKQKQLADLKKEKEDFLIAEKEQVRRYNAALADIKGQLARTKELAKQGSEGSYVKQKNLLLSEQYQVLKDIQRASERKKTVLDELIKELTVYLEDPDFNLFKKEYRLHDRLHYPVEELLKLHELMQEQVKRITILQEQHKSALTELENRKQSTIAVIEQYKKRKEAIESLEQSRGSAVLDPQQKSDLLTLEERLFTYKKTVDELETSNLEYKIVLLDLQLFIAKSQATLFRDYLNKIKSSIRVNESDISYAQEELTNQRQQFYGKKEEYRQEIERLIAQQKKTERDLARVAKNYGITLGRDIDEWTREPKQTADSYAGIVLVGALNSKLQMLEKKQELIDTQAVLDEEKFKYDSLLVQVKNSYHKITSKRFITSPEINQDIKNYDAPRAEAKAALSRYKEKINMIGDLLNNQKKVLDNIKKMRETLERQKELLFKDKAALYNQAIQELTHAEHDTAEQIDILGKLTGAYSGVTATINNILQLISFVKVELENMSKWHLQRPAYAISWNGVKNIFPDIMSFLHDIRSYAAQFSLTEFFKKIVKHGKKPLAILLFLIKLILFTLLCIIFKQYALTLTTFFFKAADNHFGFMRTVYTVLGLFIDFINSYFRSLAIWIFLLLMLQTHLPDPYLYIFFYLCSIPYLLYIAYRFIDYFDKANSARSYALLTITYHRRFFAVLSGLLYATISITLFREAFMLANYYRSELPTILLAINFIIFQISLILLITKEQILNLIPTHNDFWQWMHEQVNRYYYLILLLVITIIVMSNPYVGFGVLVLYVLFAVIYSTLLLVGLFWLHSLFKKVASRVLFSTDDDIVRERFNNAKTWFGVIIILSFLLICAMGIIIGARIWGWQITIADIKTVLYEPFIGAGTKHPIAAISLGKIFLFIFGGFIIAYALNQFVLDKIFDLLLVDAGVQHTVTSIAQYIVLLIAIFFGFQSIGLGEQVGYVLAALTFSIGWVLKEPISDFIAYFIILVQRPLKIGDYIKLDDNVEGLVRMITARNVVLRRKNSYTIIVPNSLIIARSLNNWNYARNFIAFDDILLKIDYREDPSRVRAILLQTVESHPKVLKNPKPVVRLDEFSDHGYLFMARGFLSSTYTLDKWDIASEVRLLIIKRLREEKIRIAIPVRISLKMDDALYQKELDHDDHEQASVKKD